MKTFKTTYLLLSLSILFVLPFAVQAQLFNSSSYQVLQPMVNTTVAGSSTSFQLQSTISQISVLPSGSNMTISNVGSSLTGYSSAVITWKTDVLASSTLSWGTTLAYGSATSSSVMTIEHSLPMTSLSSATKYYYKVTSYDALGIASTSDNGGAGYTLTTATPDTVTTVVSRNNDPRDLSAPLIGKIDITDITATSNVISFQTSKLANAIVKYRTAKSVLEEVGDRDNYSKSHGIKLNGLLPNTDYFFRVYVSDVYDINNQSNEVSFTTVKTGAATSSVSFTPAATLDKLSDTDKSTIEKFSKVVKVAPLTFITNAIKAFLSAIADNPTAKEINEEEFTAAVSEAAAKIISSPQISGTDISVKVAATNATVTWTTDKKADSLVAFSKGTEYKQGSSNPYTITVGFPDEQVTAHSVVLDNLEPSTLYHFQLRSQGRLGPIALSSDQTFTTSSLTPEITSVRFSAITDNAATVAWETNLPTKNTLTITNGRTGEIQTQDDKSFLKIHQLELKDFAPSTSYTLRLKAVDEAGHVSFPSVVPFTTAMSTTPPKVSQVRIVASLIPDQLDTVQTIISWKTDKPSDSQVFYGEGISKELSQSTTLDPTLTKDHIVITTQLKPAQVYQVQVRSSDPQGHMGTSDLYTTLTPRPKQSAIDLIFKNLDSTFGFLKF